MDSPSHVAQTDGLLCRSRLQSRSAAEKHVFRATCSGEIARKSIRMHIGVLGRIGKFSDLAVVIFLFTLSRWFLNVCG